MQQIVCISSHMPTSANGVDQQSTILPGEICQKKVDSIFRKLLYCRNLDIFGSVAQLVEQRPFKP